MKTCPKCSHESGTSAKICTKCGSLFVAHKPAAPMPAAPMPAQAQTEPAPQTGRPPEPSPTTVRPAQVIKAPNLHALAVVAAPGRRPGDTQPFCPAKPKGEWPHTDEEVREWVEAVMIAGVNGGRLYTPNAMLYFAANDDLWSHTKGGGHWPRVYEIVKTHTLAFTDKLSGRRDGPTEFEDDAPDGV